ncbi:MAG: cadherin-like beta sandwich domain-containing protein [Acutalibacter sp.]|nr:cadherin-like beta sandwich domain-containing protein [Acutalibacter sp.]
MRRWLPGLFLALLLLLFSLPAAAQEECAFRGTLSAKEGRGGSTVDLTVYYDGSLGPLGSFVFWVDFDSQRLACQKVSLGEGLRGHYTLDDTVGDGQAAAVYTQKTADTAYGDAGEVLKCRFQVQEGAPEGDGDFRLRTAQVYSPQGEPLCQDREEVLPFAVLGPVSSTAALLDLAPSQGALDQPFSPEQFFYTMTVPYEVKTLTFTAAPAEGASCRVNRKNLGAGGSETEFQITVTAADGKTKQVYRVTAYRQEKEPLSGEASLLELAPDTGKLEQAFSPDRLSYTMTVPYEVKTLTFTATPAEGASCRVNRKNLGAGGSETEFQITVTAADGKTKQVYRVTVYRQEKEDNLESGTGEALLLSLVPETGQLDQAFSPDRLSYTMTVPYEVKALTFTATPAEGASCRVNRKNLGAGGSETEFQITVTAADGKTKQVYRVTVYRQEKEDNLESGAGEALLLSLVPETGQLDQAFSSDKLRYTMTVPFSVTAVTFQTQPAPGASCRVNRKNLGAGGSDTEFLFTVTAADGKTKQVYSVTVHREEKESSSASGKLSPSPGQSPAPSPSPPREGEDGPYPTSVPVPVEGEEGQEAALPEILVENQDRSLAYTLALAAFLVLLYVSGPVSRWIFQKKEKAGKDKK